ncbi:MAG: T9SS type A sorting domain-containing protein [Bacteroidales bacterium]|jgi:hypothetical protein|nr:T9SS type A sorting domain-containing protein [Bacteroidales bacterium]
MKKFSTLLLFFTCSVFVFSQVNVKTEERLLLKKPDKNFINSGKVNSVKRNNNTKNIIWSQDFEGESATWSIGHLSEDNNISWVVGDAEQAIQSAGFNYYYNNINLFQQNIFSSGKAAYIDVVGVDTDPNFGGPGHDLSKSYIQFDNIDLTTAEHPKIIFSQKFIKLNDVAAYVEWKTGEENYVWTRVEINQDAVNNNEYNNDVEILLTGAGGANDLSIRFLWDNIEVAVIGGMAYPLGYWWVIDNIEIRESDPYDLVMNDFRVSSFYVRDHYSTEAIGSIPDDTEGTQYNKYFHYSSYYGTYAKDVDQGDNNILMFHGIVKNTGIANVTPGLKVEIYKEGNESNLIWSKTKYKTNTIAPGITDTVDIWYMDEDVENYFNLNLCEIGSYVVKFEALILEGEDPTPENGINYSYFRVTQDTYSRDFAEIPNSGINMANYSSGYSFGGENGDQLGVNFMFFNETELHGIDYYLGSLTLPGTAIEFSVLQWDQNTHDWATKATQRVDIESFDMAGNWHSLDFDIPAQITATDGYVSEVMLVAKFYYNGGRIIEIGNDNIPNANYHSVSWKFSHQDEWVSFISGRNISPALRLRTRPLETSDLVCPRDINISMDTITPENSLICFSGVSHEGGVYSGTNVIDGCMQIFDLDYGQYPITYTLEEDVCTFKVRLLPTDGMLCPDIVIVNMDTITQSNNEICFTEVYPEGGTFSGTNITGNCMQVLGMENGVYPVTYTYSNRSNTSSRTFNVVLLFSDSVICPDDITIDPDTITQTNSTICFSNAYPENGTYSGTNVTDNCMTLSGLENGEYPITYTYNENSCTFNVKFGESHVPDLKDLGVNIYPNPTNGSLKIDNVKGTTIEITNSMGQILKLIRNADEFNVLDISNFSNGTYFIKIIFDGKVGIERVNLIK